MSELFSGKETSSGDRGPARVADIGGMGEIGLWCGLGSGKRRQVIISFRVLIDVSRKVSSIGSGRRLGLGMTEATPTLWEVAWLLQNGRQQMWLCLTIKHGYKASFYVTNSPENLPLFRLRQAFEVCGMLSELYVARHRNARGQEFGFARFVNVKNNIKLLQTLNSVWVGECRVWAKEARFDRFEHNDVT